MISYAIFFETVPMRSICVIPGVYFRHLVNFFFKLFEFFGQFFVIEKVFNFSQDPVHSVARSYIPVKREIKEVQHTGICF